MTKLRAFPEL